MWNDILSEKGVSVKMGVSIVCICMHVCCEA